MPAIDPLLRQILQRNATFADLAGEKPLQLQVFGDTVYGAIMHSHRIEEMIREIAPPALAATLSQAPFRFNYELDGAIFQVEGQLGDALSRRAARVRIEPLQKTPTLPETTPVSLQKAPVLDDSTPNLPPKTDLRWMTFLNGQQSAPTDAAVITARLLSGDLPPATMVWKPGLPSWIPAPDSPLWPSQLPKPFGAHSPHAQQGDGTGGLIPFKNPQALLSYYIGLFALLPCLGLGMGPAALILGVRGLQYAKANPICKGTVHAWIGIVCGGLWTLVHWGVAILLLLYSASNRN